MQFIFRTNHIIARLEVVMSMKIQVMGLWIVTLCSNVVGYHTASLHGDITQKNMILNHISILYECWTNCHQYRVFMLNTECAHEMWTILWQLFSSIKSTEM